jgi:hypothetical protein
MKQTVIQIKIKITLDIPAPQCTNTDPFFKSKII